MPQFLGIQSFYYHPSPAALLPTGAAFVFNPNGTIDTLDMTAPREGPKGVQSIFIDNSNSNAKTVLTFTDTGFAIAIAPNSQGWFTAVTMENDYTFSVASAYTGPIPVFISSIAIPPNVWTV